MLGPQRYSRWVGAWVFLTLLLATICRAADSSLIASQPDTKEYFISGLAVSPTANATIARRFQTRSTYYDYGGEIDPFWVVNMRFSEMEALKVDFPGVSSDDHLIIRFSQQLTSSEVDRCAQQRRCGTGCCGNATIR